MEAVAKWVLVGARVRGLGVTEFVVARDYIPVDRDQQFLIPPDMREWLPENHLVWWLLEVIGRLDTEALHRSRRRGGQGRAGYDPDMLLALLVYAYCTKVRSSRQIERLCETDVAFRVICANRVPDHSTIARFRQEQGRVARKLFVDVVELCARAGLAQVGVVSVDGTKIAGNASKAANRDRAWIEGQIDAMFEEAEAADADEDDRFGPRRGDELPVGLGDREGRRAALEAALAELDRRDHKAGEARSQLWERHLAVAKKKLAAQRAAWAESRLTRSSRGDKPSHPQGVEVARTQAQIERIKAKIAAAADRGAKVNLTDPESRLMVSKDGWVQGYNAQAAVNEVGIIVAAEVFTDPGDALLFAPMIDALQATVGLTGPVGVVLADAGYCSTANLTAPGPARLIATSAARKVRAETATTAGPPPAGLDPIAAMTHTLRTAEGRALYKQRSRTIETSFGNIKANLGFVRFSRRGKTAVQAEWQLVATAANLLKLFRYYPGVISTG